MRYSNGLAVTLLYDAHQYLFYYSIFLAGTEHLLHVYNKHGIIEIRHEGPEERGCCVGSEIISSFTFIFKTYIMIIYLHQPFTTVPPFA